MRLLILGGDGMLGHQLLKSLASNHEVMVTLRQDQEAYSCTNIFSAHNSFFGIDVRSFDRLTEVCADFKPHAIINAVGIVKQRPTAKESIPSLEVNALLPHRLAVLCKVMGSRLIHFSTDCIFSGSKGNYLENDSSDAEDLYGKTKYLGELHEKHCLTLRTSIIGCELFRKKSLFEWFMGQEGTIKGFRKAIYNGFTTIEMARIISMMLTRHPNINGVWHVSSEPIDKYALLQLFKTKTGKQIEIVADDSFVCDRSLDSNRFRKTVGYTPPTWEAMITELAKERLK
ncbi:MAG: SDR family oxidoreductase [Geobacteraceae bacterium]|nr:SDR family oxidoreductase [Geobacteraceae bacterium]